MLQNTLNLTGRKTNNIQIKQHSGIGATNSRKGKENSFMEQEGSNINFQFTKNYQNTMKSSFPEK